MKSSNEQIRNGLSTAADTHDLGAVGRDRLMKIILGIVPGNRDKPLFGLAQAIQECAGEAQQPPSIFDLLATSQNPNSSRALPKLSLALLDYLVSMDDYRYFEEVQKAVDKASSATKRDELASASNILSSCLHKHRVEHIPYENRRQQFAEIRKFFSDGRGDMRDVEDGDAITFWSEVASGEIWTTYTSTYHALVDYFEAGTGESSTEASMEEMAERGFDPVASVFDIAEGDQPDFSRVASELETANIKVMKGPELDDLKRLAAAFPGLVRWPRSGAACFSFGPIQSILTQMKRQTAAIEDGAIVATVDRAMTYEQIMESLDSLESTCRDFGLLLQSLNPQFSGNASGASILNGEDKKRIERLLRRKSFIGIEQDQMQAMMSDLLPAMATATALVRRTAEVLSAWSRSGTNHAFAEDLEVFKATFHRLYSSEGDPNDASR